MSTLILSDGMILEIPSWDKTTITTHHETTASHDLATRTEARMLELAENGGTPPNLRGYANHASSKTSQ